MNSHIEIRLQSARLRAHEAIRVSSRERLAQPSRSSFRRSIGHSIIRFGERLAAESSLEPARSIRG